MEQAEKFLTRMYRTDPDFVFTVSRDFVRAVPDAGADPARRRSGASLRGRDGERDAGAECRSQHVSVEGAEGSRAACGAPDPLVPARAPASDGVTRQSFRRHSGMRALARRPGIHNPSRGYGFRVRRYAAPRNDEVAGYCFFRVASTLRPSIFQTWLFWMKRNRYFTSMSSVLNTPFSTSAPSVSIVALS